MVFACPRCHSPLEQLESDRLRCPADGLIFMLVDGIWRFLLPERSEYYASFVREYETVRRSEGRGSTDAAYYRALPYYPTSDWQIRATSFDALLESVTTPIERVKGLLQVLDLGAGNSWLSNRLASRGHNVAAVDLTVNDFDGLGCRRFYESTFLSVQAEFDHLPFPDGSVDMVLYNASLHYSIDYDNTLREALRITDVDGKLVVLDSPVYRDADSGRSMVRERKEQFVKRHGFASDALQSENYLTYQRMDELGVKLGITWRHIRPYYGIRWVSRPWKARLLHQREPAEFGLWVGTK